MMGMRSERVQRQLKKEISLILQEDLRDPRIGFVTLTRIDLTGDLRYAKVYFSVLGDEAAKQSSTEGIQSAVGYIRRLIGERLKLKYVPEISFKLDKSIEYSINLEKTFERLKNEREQNQDGNKEVQ
ncbi:MAG: 30S ribosome-binding factor RbfA [Candidatus Omnitrophica bacterium]|nr:30S ribosome-binding factor RbfA [Candidatus Omnitrophota bacterium]